MAGIEEPQRFTVTRPNQIAQLIYLFATLSLLLYFLGYRHFHDSAFIVFILAFSIIYSLLLQIVRKYFKWSKRIELYNEKLVIGTNDKPVVVDFSNIRKYKSDYRASILGTGLGYWVLVIRQKSGTKNKIIADNQDMLNLIRAFDASIDLYNKNTSSDIQKTVKCDGVAEGEKYGIPIVLIGGILILTISLLILLWRNGLRPDYI